MCNIDLAPEFMIELGFLGEDDNQSWYIKKTKDKQSSASLWLHSSHDGVQMEVDFCFEETTHTLPLQKPNSITDAILTWHRITGDKIGIEKPQKRQMEFNTESLLKTGNTINDDKVSGLGFFTHDYYLHFINKKSSGEAEVALFIYPDESEGGWVLSVAVSNKNNGPKKCLEWELPKPKSIDDIVATWFRLTGDRLAGGAK